MKRGRKTGSKYPPHPGSLNDWLSKIPIGKSAWVETTKEKYIYDMRLIQQGQSRRPAGMENTAFTVELWQAIAVGGTLQDTRCLLRITARRLKGGRK